MLNGNNAKQLKSVEIKEWGQLVFLNNIKRSPRFFRLRKAITKEKDLNSLNSFANPTIKSIQRTKTP
ncbi:hypothetical protein HMPREF1451_01233 [Helicobacter pylori HP260BFii]|uniref:Uncharacterized protein n=1 Tax=Helicobacter pylori GAM260BSi TaxID=1159046 RepID=M3PG59_HELPX|nr:hypothetical protein HMPREF1418_00795 [Helicobacter pylori GAM260BSi]EMH66989.1 hypothetical protein HMPREF1451_01233 [Helicobacter pylori HP260BFii]